MPGWSKAAHYQVGNSRSQEKPRQRFKLIAIKAKCPENSGQRSLSKSTRKTGWHAGCAPTVKHSLSIVLIDRFLNDAKFSTRIISVLFVAHWPITRYPLIYSPSRYSLLDLKLSTSVIKLQSWYFRWSQGQSSSFSSSFLISVPASHYWHFNEITSWVSQSVSPKVSRESLWLFIAGLDSFPPRL